ncbi:helix-turn-helix domain-containing protein [Tundrisphaera lichenicola]|uniref:helix-turn-helix domain-containing protein n=1 Tax=Tundrisphaera lichenicola TaxID=2029860 RepID=UPI003EBA63AB
MPAKPWDEVVARLPEQTRKAIEVRTGELLAAEATLSELRSAQHQSQAVLAERLGVNQAAVSKMERRTDMYLSTLRDYIQAMGGELEIVARFPGKPPVVINQFRSLGE